MNSDLPSTRRLVAFVVSFHMDADGDECFPALELIAAESGLSKSTIALALNELERRGWIRRTRSSVIGRPAKDDRFKTPVTRYTATLPEVSDSRTLPDEDKSPTVTQKVSDSRSESV